MPNVDPTHIIAYACVDQAENDTDPEGGGIDATVRVYFSLLVPKDSIQVVNSSGLDNGKICSVVMRDKSGHKIITDVVLAGTATILLPTEPRIDRMLKVMLTANANGQVKITADGGSNIAVIPAGERGARTMFIDSFFDLASKTYYEKFFWKNADPVHDMQDPVVNRDKSTSEFPEIGFCDFALATALNDQESVANRLTGPVSTSEFSDSDKAVPGSAIPRAQCVGVWLAMRLRRKNGFRPGTFKYGTRIVSQSPA